MIMQERFVICKGSSGMGNRILAACTATLYSQIADRNLIIDWRDGSYSEDGVNSFSCFFDHTDAKPIENLTSLGSVYPKCWSGNLDRSFGSLRAELKISDKEISFDVSRTDYKESILVFCAYTHKIHQMRPLFRDDFDYLNHLDYRDILKSILDSSFRIKNDINQVVKSFKSSSFGSKTIGVHVRHTDMSIPLDRLVKTTRSIVDRRQSDCIFLATDNRDIIDVFKQKFDNVVVAPKWFPSPGERMHQNWDSCPNRIQNGREALIDLYLLAECDDLVFSSQSSFGYVASILSNVSDRSYLHDIKYDVNKFTSIDRFKTLISRNLRRVMT